MKDNYTLESNARPRFRILAGGVGVLFVAMAVWSFIDTFIYGATISIKAPLAWFFCGLAFLVIAWRGELIRKKKSEV